jgi:hypothetical protein
MPTRRLRLASPLTALVLGAVVLALLAATIPVASANHIFALHDLPTVVLIVTTTVVGVVIARHLPANFPSPAPGNTRRRYFLALLIWLRTVLTCTPAFLLSPRTHNRPRTGPLLPCAPQATC